MVLTQTAIYALKAALYLTEHAREEHVTVDDISGALDVPRNYLSKILHTLARTNVLESTRGPNGGFRLALDPSTTPLSVIIEPFDDLVEGSTCLLGRESCGDDHPCPAHSRWKHSAEALQSFFADTTLSDLSCTVQTQPEASHG